MELVFIITLVLSIVMVNAAILTHSMLRKKFLATASWMVFVQSIFAGGYSGFLVGGIVGAFVGSILGALFGVVIMIWLSCLER